MFEFSKRAAIAAGLALLVPSADAYSSGDVDAVDIRLLYTAGGGEFLNKEQKFTITTENPDGFLRVLPGTFILNVDGKLSSSHPDYASGVVNAFEGVTTHTISHISDYSSITVICLDKEVYDDVDSSVNQAPIILSINIDQAVLRPTEVATLTFTAIDPNINEAPGDYIFAVPSGQGSVANPSGSCSTGTCGGTSSQPKYTADTSDSGNLAFAMDVRDQGYDGTSNMLKDSVAGSLLVDDSGSIQFGLNNYHRPNSISVSSNVTSVGFGEVASITITVDDEDLVIAALADSLKLRGATFTDNTLTGTSWSYPLNSEGAVKATNTLKQVYQNQEFTDAAPTGAEHENLGCHNADLSITTPASNDGGTTVTWTVTWNPWFTANSADSSSYGLVSCGLVFQAFDSKNLLSDEVTITLSAVSTDQDMSFSDIPQFELIFMDDLSPVAGEKVIIDVWYSDPNPNSVTFDLEAATGSSMVSAYELDSGVSTAWPVENKLTILETSCVPTGSQAESNYQSGCSHRIVLTIATDAELGTHDDNKLTLRVTDDESGYADTRVLNALDIQAARRGRRGAGPGRVTRQDDGVLVIAATTNGEQLSVSLVSDIGSSSTGGIADDDTHDQQGKDNGEHNAAAESEGLSAGVIGGAVAGTVLAVGLVAFVARRKVLSKRTAVPDAALPQWEHMGSKTHSLEAEV